MDWPSYLQSDIHIASSPLKVSLPTGTMSSLSSMNPLWRSSRQPSPWSSNAKEFTMFWVMYVQSMEVPAAV